MFEFPRDPARPGLLVSVRDAAEARAAARAGADLVDAKDPAAGALGALPPEAVRAMCEAAGDRATSAVAPGPEHVAAWAATGVDLVKIAVPPALLADPAALARASAAAPGRLVAVLFAEDAPGPDDVPALAAAGLRGAMIDTAGKSGARLPDLLPPARLAAFVAAARGVGLLAGLAGSLRVTDIPALAAHGPDYLGFRGGLCRGLDRRDGVEPARVAEAVRALDALAGRRAA